MKQKTSTEVPTELGISDGITEKAEIPDVIPVTLNIPIHWKKGEKEEKIIDELVLHRIKLKSFRRLPEDDSTLPLRTFLIAESAQLPIEIIEEIDIIDLSNIMEALDPFLAGFLRTGRI